MREWEFIPLPFALSITSLNGSRPKASSSSSGVFGPGIDSGPNSSAVVAFREVATFFASARLSAICSRILSAGLVGSCVSAFEGERGGFAGEREPDFTGDGGADFFGPGVAASRAGAGARTGVPAGRVRVGVPGAEGVEVVRTRGELVEAPRDEEAGARPREELAGGMRDIE
jgi:hypothetical protein